VSGSRSGQGFRYGDAVTSEPAAVVDIDPAECRLLVDGGAFLLDVREDDEWEAGHAREAVHVAMGLVPDRLDEIPTDRTVVCVCRVGGRSGAVAASLAGAGFDVRNLGGGMLAWEATGLPVVTDDGSTGRVI
jgi:rhodanese-related sulfurtransferase